MAIKREELDRREVDLSDVVSGQRLPPVHPGQILRDDYLIPMGLSVYRPAQELRILAALPDTLEVPLESLRGEQAH